MNNFTKEELKILNDAVEAYGDYSLGEHPYHILTTKLQYLIDNYGSLDSIRASTDLHGGCKL